MKLLLSKRRINENTSFSCLIFSWGDNTSSDVWLIDECTRKRKLLKKLLLLFSLLLSFNSFGYVKVNEDTSDNSYYIDFTTVKKVEDYVFWWEMRDNIKEDDAGFLSSQTYYKGDCNLSRRTINALYRYTENKRGGDGVDMSFNGMYNLEETLGWTYPPPDSVGYDNLKIVCKLVEELSPANRNRTCQLR